MTALADHDQIAETATPAVLVDMRCSAVLDHGATPERCQLLAGHEGRHALMYSDSDRRHVLFWTNDGPRMEAGNDWTSRPWMRGFPFPAWFDSASDVSSTESMAT